MDAKLGEALQQAHDLAADMVKQMANEPSVGLYFVQQHVHKAVPAIVSLKDQVGDCAHDSGLSTEDAKDALATVKNFKGVGPPVIERMIKRLNSSIQALQSSRSKESSYSVSEMAKNAKKLVSSPFKSEESPTSKPSDSSTNYARNLWDSAVDRASSFTRKPSSPIPASSSPTPDTPPSPPAEAPAASSPSPYGYVRLVLESASQRVGSIGWSDSSSSKEDRDKTTGSTEELKLSSDNSSNKPVRAVLDTISTSKTQEAEESEAPAGEGEIPGNSTEIQEGFDRFQAESAAKLAAWLDKP
ncbi:hypothetical protein SELMODRAFT_442733 [Selaginella moellendorffii]|uniref:Uncharacterized protein n=1 Tax=Selaginella moellendorffii TaxID=88036 RepID=D8RVL8_SELML|nr:hypothetical protein SELMODRAFT_442733 [Selaginella moellendorffii]